MKCSALGYQDDHLLVDFFQYWLNLMEEGVATSPDVDSAVQSTEDELIVHGTTAIQAVHSNLLIGLMEAAERPLKLMILHFREVWTGTSLLRHNLYR